MPEPRSLEVQEEFSNIQREYNRCLSDPYPDEWGTIEDVTKVNLCDQLGLEIDAIDQLLDDYEEYRRQKGSVYIEPLEQRLNTMTTLVEQLQGVGAPPGAKAGVCRIANEVESMKMQVRAEKERLFRSEANLERGAWRPTGWGWVRSDIP